MGFWCLSPTPPPNLASFEFRRCHFPVPRKGKCPKLSHLLPVLPCFLIRAYQGQTFPLFLLFRKHCNAQVWSI